MITPIYKNQNDINKNNNINNNNNSNSIIHSNNKICSCDDYKNNAINPRCIVSCKRLRRQQGQQQHLIKSNSNKLLQENNKFNTFSKFSINISTTRTTTTTNNTLESTKTKTTKTKRKRKFLLNKLKEFIQLLTILNQLQFLNVGNSSALLVDPTALEGITSSKINIDNDGNIYNVGGGENSDGGISSNSNNSGGGNSGGGGGGGGPGHYLDLERSVGAVLIKVAYGTTSTTKRSIPDNNYVPSLTTIATPPLTTLRYLEKSQHQQQINLHHRNYELDLERDHALPTSAPNADILKSNSNPTYPNPNRHHNHDRDRHRHLLNSTPSPSVHNLLKKGPPTIPMYPGDMPSYSPPARSFFTPPLPPEYQNPFADKPTLRGTNNDAGIVNTGTYINRRPIPPPSLMPGHERIPFRPPDLNSSNGGSNIGNGNAGANNNGNLGGTGGGQSNYQDSGGSSSSASSGGGMDIQGNLGNNKQYNNNNNEDGQRKKALNTPSQKINNKMDNNNHDKNNNNNNGINIGSNSQILGTNLTDTSFNSGHLHFPSITRILSGSNGRQEDIPEVLLRTVTVRPSNYHPPPSSPVKQSPIDGKNSNINQSKNGNTNDNNGDNSDGQLSEENENPNIDNDDNVDVDDDDFDMFIDSSISNNEQDEPKTQPKIKMSTKSTENPKLNINNDDEIYSTQKIHNLANINNEKSLLTTISPNNNNNNNNNKDSTDKNSNSDNLKNGGNNNANVAATWTVAWNIHVYLSAILFTILAVYSIFKMIFYDKLTHLFNQSYFICINLILIIICLSRIFYLCYDAYNIHSTFHLFISEILLNLPATFLTISFSVLILFLLIRSLNHKNNRYSSLIRPLTVVVGSGVHVCLCITLHYVESYTTSHSHQMYYYQQQQYQLYRNNYRTTTASTLLTNPNNNIMVDNNIIMTTNALLSGGGNNNNIIGGYNHQLQAPPPPPPRVLSLICQIIYIFVCLSLGLLYLYIYRILKRVLRSKSQNYIHGYQNLSYAIHITIATALLFVLLAALQIYGAISISTTRPLITSSSEIDWLQWGYQFSLRLIEIAIITLMSWVAGLKTGGGGIGSGNGNGSGVVGSGNGGGNSSILHRGEKQSGHHHNVSGFALFPCTSSSSQEHFETDYPAVCNANTNLHTYTLRTGKPIYDDNFALNSLGGGGSVGGGVNSTGAVVAGSRVLQHPANDFHQIQNSNDFVRSYETSSLRSTSGGSHHHHHHHHHQQQHHHPHHQQLDTGSGHHSDFLTDPQTDHYENPNFELRSTSNSKSDNCYSEPLNPTIGRGVSGGGHHQSYSGGNSGNYDFQNFERPVFSGGATTTGLAEQRPNSGSGSGPHIDDFHATTKSNKQIKSNATINMNLDRSNYDNPERRSSNSTHSCASGRNYTQYNSFERRSGIGGGGSGVRKSGTLSNIGGISHTRNGGGGGSSSSSSAGTASILSTSCGGGASSGGVGVGGTSSASSSSRPSGVQTLSSTRNSQNSGGRISSTSNAITKPFFRGTNGVASGIGERNHRSSLERSSSAAIQQQYMIPSDDDFSNQPERVNLIKSSVSTRDGIGLVGGANFGVTNSTSGGNLTENCLQHNNATHQPTSASSSPFVGGTSGGSSSGDSATSGSMLVAEHGFVRFRALDDINNAQGVGIHNASIRTNGRTKEKRFTNNT